jgi:hypothetical protein
MEYEAQMKNKQKKLTLNGAFEQEAFLIVPEKPMPCPRRERERERERGAELRKL